MKTIILALLAGCSAIMAAMPSLAADTCGAKPVRYAINHVGGTQFEVNIEFAITGGQFDVGFHPSEAAPQGEADFITAMQARNATGDWQDVNYIGEGSWTLPDAKTAGYTALRYTLSAEHDRASWDIGKEEIAYGFDEAFYFVGSAVLPMDYSWAECDFEVKFDIPANWTIVAPWPKTGDNSFAVHGANNVHRNLFVTGPGLRPHNTVIGGMDVVILEQEAFREAAPVFQSLLSQSIERYVELFGSAPVKQYLVVFGEDDGNDGGAFAQSFGQRLPAPIRAHEKLMWGRALAHEALHSWIGITIRPKVHAELQWFSEGGTDYLTGKTLFRIGQIDANDLLFITEGQVRRYFLGRMASGPVSLADAGVEKQKNRQLVYGGGALFHLFLDAHMTAKNGKGSYEALWRSLYENSSQPYSFTQMMAAMDEASDGAASEIYAFLNAPFNPNTFLQRMTEIGLPTAAFGPDELLVRFSGNGCSGSREARCMPAFLAK